MNEDQLTPGVYLADDPVQFAEEHLPPLDGLVLGVEVTYDVHSIRFVPDAIHEVTTPATWMMTIRAWVRGGEPPVEGVRTSGDTWTVVGVDRLVIGGDHVVHLRPVAEPDRTALLSGCSLYAPQDRVPLHRR